MLSGQWLEFMESGSARLGLAPQSECFFFRVCGYIIVVTVFSQAYWESAVYISNMSKKVL